YCGGWNSSTGSTPISPTTAIRSRSPLSGTPLSLMALAASSHVANRPLVVADPVAHQHVALAPGRVEHTIGRAAGRPPLVLVDGGVHVAVEDEAPAVAGAGQDAEQVRAVGHEGDLAGREALAAQPLVDVVGHRPLLSGGAVDVGEVEG